MAEEKNKPPTPQRPLFVVPKFYCVSEDGFGSVIENNSSFLLVFRMMSFGYILSTCRILASNSHGLGLLTLRP